MGASQGVIQPENKPVRKRLLPEATLLNLARVATLLVVIAITLYVFSIRDRAEEFARYGYPGIFLLSVLSHATVILPAPGLAVVFAFGAVFNPFWVGIVAALGGTVGELSGYAAGFSGRGVMERVNVYLRMRDWMLSHPRLALGFIALMALIPNPLFDLAGMASGALHIPVSRFFVATLFGKTIKMLIFAYAGMYSIDWILGFLK